jgi:type I restriction enzyme S subunit
MSSYTLGPGHRPISQSELPDQWSAKRLGDLVTVSQGGKLGLTKENDYVSSGVPAYSAAGQDGFVDCAEFRDQPGVVLSAIGANCGRCFYAEGDWTTLANVQAILPTKQLNARFLYYRANIENYWTRSGSAQPFIKPSSVKTSWIAFPDPARQRRIAEILSTLDEAIEQTEALIAKHQQIKAGLMHDLFTRGVTPDGHLRPTREQAPDLYKESPLGWIPKEWCIKRVRELGIVKGGKRVPAGTPFADAPTPFPYLRVTDMVDGWIDDTALEYVDSTTERLISSYKILRDDIYVTIAGTLGQFGRIPEHLNGAQLTENAARITEIDQETVEPDFLCAVLRSDLLEKQKFAGIGVGAGVPKLALYQIERFQVPISSVEEQRQIRQLLSCSQRNILENRAILKKLCQQKQGLMHDLLTGHVGVKI